MSADRMTDPMDEAEKPLTADEQYRAATARGADKAWADLAAALEAEVQHARNHPYVRDLTGVLVQHRPLIEAAAPAAAPSDGLLGLLQHVRRVGFPEHREDECFCDTCWSYLAEDNGGDPERLAATEQREGLDVERLARAIREAGQHAGRDVHCRLIEQLTRALAEQTYWMLTAQAAMTRLSRSLWPSLPWYTRAWATLRRKGW